MLTLRTVRYVALLAAMLQCTIVCAQEEEKAATAGAATEHAEPATKPDEHADAKTADHVDAGHEVAAHTTGGGHAEENDPTHVNMTDAGQDPAEWRSEKAIASLVVFGLLLLGLSAVAWKPISEGLAKREKTIADNIANAEKASHEAISKLEQYEAKLAAANEEAQQILSEARKAAEATGQRLVATAQEEAARQRERAVAEIESAKSVALNELAQKSTDVAMTLAQRIVGREVNAADHQNLIQEMLSKLPSNN